MAGKEAHPERAAWPSFLRGGDPEEIYARLSQGDPLRLLEHAAQRLRVLWYLLEPERVYKRALQLLDVTPADTWMVGDNLEWDVAEPQRQGIFGIWIDLRGSGLPKGHPVRPDRIIRRLSELREPNGGARG